MLPIEREVPAVGDPVTFVGVGDPGNIVAVVCSGPSLWASVNDDGLGDVITDGDSDGSVVCKGPLQASVDDGVGTSDDSIDPPVLLVRTIKDDDESGVETNVLVLFCSLKVSGPRAVVVPRVDMIGIETILPSMAVVTVTKECRGCWSAESEIWTMLLVVVTNCDTCVSLSDSVK